MSEKQSGRDYVAAMARAMKAADRLGDFVVGLAHEGGTGALSVILEEFGVEAFAPGRGGKSIRNFYDKGYMVDAYDAAIAAKRPDVVEWLAQNKVPVHGVVTGDHYRTEPEDRAVHYNAVVRALYGRDETSLVLMVKHGAFNLRAPIVSTSIQLGREKGTDGPAEIIHSTWEKEVVVDVHQPRLLDLCAAYRMPNVIRAILDVGYEATPSFFKTALALRDGGLIEQSIGKSTNVKTLASKLLAASADSNMLQSMRFALAYGANPNEAIPSYGALVQSHPLFFCKSPEAVHLLCDAGAYVDMRNEEGATPLLYFAGESGVSKAGEIMTALIERGADVERRNKNDRTIGQIASRSSDDIKRIIRAAKTGQLVRQSIEAALPDLDDAPATASRRTGISPI